MKSYLQRLAARAEGVGPTPSLIPTGRNETISRSDHDSAFAETDPAERKSRPGDAPAISPPEPQSFAPLPSKLRPTETTLRDVRGEVAGEAFNAKNISVQPDIASPTKALPSDIRSNEQSPDRSLTNTNPSVSNLLSPRELNLDPNRIRTSGTKASADPASAENNLPVVANREPVAPLEPRLMEAPPVPIPAPDEPRLVIGQMRVDVVATAPPKTREVVRMVTRTIGPGNGSRAGSPISKLRFGLGQM